MILGMSGNGTNNSSNNTLSILIVIVATALVAVIGIGIGLSLSNRGETQTPAAPSTSASIPESQSSTSTATASPTTTITTTVSPTTSSSRANSPKSSTRKSTTEASSSAGGTASADNPEDTTSQDFGTGRTDLDQLGFIGASARCDSHDRAFAVLATEGGIKAAACETSSGEKYYRSDTPQGALSTEIIVDEGDRVVARNGSYKYQMSPAGLLVTKNNEVIKRYPAIAWGTA